MRIQQINSQNNFKAVNQKYYKWAEKEAKGVHRFGEILFQIEADVCWKDMHPIDAIDTINAIKKIAPNYEGFELSLDYIKKFLPSQK